MLCRSRQQGREKEIPVRSKSKQPVPVHLAAGILRQGEGFLLRKRPAKGVLAGMWEFPAVEIGQGESAHTKLAAMFRNELNQEIAVESILKEIDHTFSHRIWHISFYECKLLHQEALPDSHLLWAPRQDWPQLSFAGPYRKVAQFLMEKGGFYHDPDY